MPRHGRRGSMLASLAVWCSACVAAGGYHTGIVGKWHLGSDPTGFDRWIVLPGQGDYRDPTFITPRGRLSIAGHCTQVTTNLGLEFLRTRPQDKPFFLMLHHKAPHRPWEPDERNRARFAAASPPEPPTLFDDYSTRPAALPENKQTIARDLTRRDLKLRPPDGLTAEALRPWLDSRPMELEIDGKRLTGPDLVRWKYRRFMQDYLACVQGVDDGIGQVLDWLDREGLADDTIVIYTTDNGWYLGDLGLYDKRFMYEPGLRVPLIVRGPEQRNLLFDPAEASSPSVAGLRAKLEAELRRLQLALNDTGLYADATTWPRAGVGDGGADRPSLGRMDVVAAIAAAR